MSDPQKFDFVGSIPDVLLEKVPLDNAIIRAYRKSSLFSVRPIPAELQKIIDEGDEPKRVRKRKTKAATLETIKIPNRSKKPV